MLHLLAADTTSDTVLAVPLPWVTFAVATGIPLLVALLSKSSASSQVKGFLALLLSAITAVGVTLIDNGGSAPAVELVSAFFATILTAQTAHATVWRPKAEAAVQRAVPAGIG